MQFYLVLTNMLWEVDIFRHGDGCTELGNISPIRDWMHVICKSWGRILGKLCLYVRNVNVLVLFSN